MSFPPILLKIPLCLGLHHIDDRGYSQTQKSFMTKLLPTTNCLMKASNKNLSVTIPFIELVPTYCKPVVTLLPSYGGLTNLSSNFLNLCTKSCGVTTGIFVIILLSSLSGVKAFKEAVTATRMFSSFRVNVHPRPRGAFPWL